MPPRVSWLIDFNAPKLRAKVCKVIDLRKGDESNIFQEAKLLASLHHPYVVRYRDSFCTDARREVAGLAFRLGTTSIYTCSRDPSSEQDDHDNMFPVPKGC